MRSFWIRIGAFGLVMIAFGPLTAFVFRVRPTRPPLEMQRYKSSTLGLSIDFPREWRKFIPGTCGSGLWPLPTDEELLRRPICVVAVRNSQQTARVIVDHYRKFDQDLANVMRSYNAARGTFVDRVTGPRQSISDFDFGGIQGKRIESTGCYVSEQEPRAGTVVSYVFVHDHRRVDICASCLTSDYPSLWATFDAVARSLALTQPAIDPPRAGTWKCLSRAGFSFEYPGDWNWPRPFDDDATVEEDWMNYVVAPRLTKSTWMSPQMSVLDLSKSSRSLAEYRRECERIRGEYVEIRPFITAAGQAGLRVFTGRPGMMVALDSITVSFAIETRDGRLKSLVCTCPAALLAECEPLFDHAGQSFCIHEQPGGNRAAR